MGQKHSKDQIEELYSSGKESIKPPSRRPSADNRRIHPNTVFSTSGFDSYRNIDNMISKIGVSNEDSETGCLSSFLLFLDSSDIDEVIHPKDQGDMREKLHKLYDYRLNRFKARLSAMYPQRSSHGSVNVSRFRSTTMIELISYLDTQTQLRLKSVNRFFHKLIIISHNDVSLSARAGWFSVIHLSSFLKRIRLYGQPKERELKDFTTMLQNDGFTELDTIELYHIGEWAMLEIIEALSQRVQRAIRLGILDDSMVLNLVIQETEITPFFAGKLAKNINTVLFRVLARLKFIVKSVEGIEIVLTSVLLSKCNRLVEVDFSSIPLLRHGFELLVDSIWSSESESQIDCPRIQQLHLSNTGLTDPCLVFLVDVTSQGLLANLELLDLSDNCLTNEGVGVINSMISPYLCPNLHSFILSNNCNLGGEALQLFFGYLGNGVCPVIEDIALNNCGMKSTDLIAFASFLLTPFSESLKSVDIGNNPGLSTEMARFWTNLSKSPCVNLRVINVEGIAMRKKSERAFVKWVLHGHLENLRCLYLNNTLFDQRVFCQFLRALTFSNIKDLDVLDLSSNLIGSFHEKDWELLVYETKQLHQHSFTIRRFEFSHNPLNNVDLEWLCKYIQRFCCVELLQEACFEDNTISSRGIAAFLNIFHPNQPSGLIKLSVITLSLQCIGKDLYNWLCSPASFNLRRLILTNCNLCFQDLTCLLNALEETQYCRKIQYLKLSGNYNIDDQFMTHFIQVYGVKGILPFLYELDLSYTSITKVGCYELLDFFKNHESYSLRRLNLSYTKLSEHRVGLLFGEFKQYFRGGCMF